MEVVEHFIDDRLFVINTICNWRDAVRSTIMLAKELESDTTRRKSRTNAKQTNYKKYNKKKLHFLERQEGVVNKGRGRRADRTQRTNTINEGINIDGVRKEQVE